MKTDAEPRAPSEPERFAFTEYDARCVLFSYALRGLLMSDGLPELLNELTARVNSVDIGAMLGHADRLATAYQGMTLSEAGQRRVSPWIPGPRRRAVALWLREQD